MPTKLRTPSDSMRPTGRWNKLVAPPGARRSNTAVSVPECWIARRLNSEDSAAIYAQAHTRDSTASARSVSYNETLPR